MLHQTHKITIVKKASYDPFKVRDLLHVLNNRFIKSFIKWTCFHEIFFKHVMVPPTDLFGHGQALRVGDGGELLLLQFLNGVLVISQIKLGSYQDDWSVWTVVSHFWIPLNTHTTHFKMIKATSTRKKQTGLSPAFTVSSNHYFKITL